MRRCSAGLLRRALPLMLASCLLAPEGAEAYVRSQVPGSRACLYWGAREVPWYLNERGSSEIDDGSDLEAVISSFEAWNEPDCSDLTFVLGGLTPRVDVGYVDGSGDNKNLVVFRDVLCTEVVPSDDPCWSCFDHGGPCCPAVHDCWSHAPGAIAITTTTFHRSTGLLVDADIEMNEARYLLTTGDGPVCEDGHGLAACDSDGECRPHEACMRGACRTRGCIHTDIANTVTHEVGHVLGLDHTPIPEATMYASASVGETHKRSLHEDDIQGLCDIYPAGGPTLTCLGDVVTMVPLESVDDTPGCLGCSKSGRGGPYFALVLAVLLLGFYPRRPRSCKWPLRCSALPVLLLGGMVVGGVPGDLERWLAEGSAMVVAASTAEPRSCGAGGLPAMTRAEVRDVAHGEVGGDVVDLLLVPGGGEMPPQGEPALLLLRRVTPEDGGGCVTAPEFAVEDVLAASDLSDDGRAAWRRYAAAAAALPPGGGALKRARARLWLDAVHTEAGDVRAHASSSLESWAEGESLSDEVVERLGSALADPTLEGDARSSAARILAAVVRRNLRHVASGAQAEAAEARAILLLALQDHDSSVRRAAVEGLAPLAAAGDHRSLDGLGALLASEEDPEIEALLEGLVSTPSGPEGLVDREANERRLGIRMLLVLLGLAALLGMALLPLLLGHLR